MNNKALRIPVLALFILLWASSSNAWAYVDPGSGTLLWQFLLAAAVGGIFLIRRFFFHIKAVIRRILGKIRNRNGR